HMAVRYANNARLEELRRLKVSYWSERNAAAPGPLAQLDSFDLNDARALVVLGDLAFARDQLATADNYYRQALELNPSLRDARATVERARVLAETPRESEAEVPTVVDIAPGLLARTTTTTHGLVEGLDDGSLLLRPSADEPTIVRLPQSCPRGAVKIAAV